MRAQGFWERRIDAFKQLKEVGSGGYGRVVLAKHRISKALFAIKILPKAGP